MYNLEEMLKLREWAHTSNEFDLRFWAASTACGTTLCLAGKVVVDAGYELIWGKLGDAVRNPQTCTPPGGGESLRISTAARGLLGLVKEESHLLFTPSLEDVATEAASASETDGVDVTEVQEKVSLDFLDLLIERARRGERNMSADEVTAWEDNWVGQHWDELEQTGVSD